MDLSVYKSFKTTNAHNKKLSMMNGSISLSNLRLNNVMINGTANLGKESKETIFSDVLVANGNLIAQHSSFDILEVNGNSELELCTILKLGEFFGNALLKNCQFNNLILSGKNFNIINSIITGNIRIQSIYGKAQLILENTIIQGNIDFNEKNIEIIRKNNNRTCQ